MSSISAFPENLCASCSRWLTMTTSAQEHQSCIIAWALLHVRFTAFHPTGLYNEGGKSPQRTVQSFSPVWVPPPHGVAHLYPGTSGALSPFSDLPRCITCIPYRLPCAIMHAPILQDAVQPNLAEPDSCHTNIAMPMD